MSEKIVYYGTDKVIEQPDLENGEFSCTSDIKKAKDCAGSFSEGGILNIYALEQESLTAGDVRTKGHEVTLLTGNSLRALRFLGFGPVDCPEKGKKRTLEKRERKPLIGELCIYIKQVRHEEPENFFRLFRISGLAKDWEEGNGESFEEMNAPALYGAVMKRLGSHALQDTEAEAALPEDPQTLWIGSLLDFVQRKTGKGFSSILEDISFRELEVLYEPLKALSMEQSFQVIREKIRQKGKKTWIQRIRRRRGLSQRELAEQSGVNLRTLQQYEIRDKDIDKAGAAKLLAMARVLSCRPEELMEW
ncbi:MAG: helix-turn-helix transcriptional regulator [Lachnospiraceae bacterium]|nr:helix-turn-helix transcriptional regulator [Lachnospiraceae bacterium]